MESPLLLSDQEQKYYHNLFRKNDDGSGKIPGFRAQELFKAAGLTTDILCQISELCGATRLGHYKRSQFFIALKLIAAAQNGLPVKLDSFGKVKDMSLPTFTAPVEDEKLKTEVEHSCIGDGVRNIASGQLPPPPAKKHGRSSSGQWRGIVMQVSDPVHHDPQNANHKGESVTQNSSFKLQDSQQGLVKQQSSPLPIDSGDLNQPHSPISSRFPYSADNVANEDPVGWANFDDDDCKGLLGTGQKQLSDHLDHALDSSSISSETDSIDDVWVINDEQREYYIEQFRMMQPDTSSMITGNVAKEFFEISKLPVQELSKIWQLSDVNKDGMLSLDEFCTAMHLVVLRRNNYELPDYLPASLMPYTALIEDEPFAANLPKGSTIKRASPAVKQWETSKTPESQLTPDVTLGIKPVNFEAVPPDHNSRVIHPVAIRADSPERSRALSDTNAYESLESESGDVLSPSKPRAFTYCDHTEPLKGRPRPIAKKPITDWAAAGGGHSLELSLPPPPQIPPRPSQHNRSVSVDLKLRSDPASNAPPVVPPRILEKNKCKIYENLRYPVVDAERAPISNKSNHFEPTPSQEALNHKPLATCSSTADSHFVEGHRRTVSLDFQHLVHTTSDLNTSTHDTNFANFTENILGGDTSYNPSDKMGEETLVEQADEVTNDETDAPIRQASRDRRDYHIAIRTHRERNNTLSRLNCELNQEYQEVMEQRIALEIQLQHLRPFYS